jgi:serine/threonine-protein kinase
VPFTREDRLLLSTLASSAARALEDKLRGGPGLPVDEERAATECVACGAIAPAAAGPCVQCGGRMETSKVPLTLRAKFRFEQRIGRGGMGVVYRATDVHLGRQVAIKTLPWVAPYLAGRLRREARAMAVVSHPNLAVIHGVEFFQGIPMLVVEYLAGGTLADRVRERPLPWRDAVVLGATLAEAVDRIHEAGILHRDIKPSNVGFTADGTPKLLDFGLARSTEAADGGGIQLSAPWAIEAVPAGASGGSDSEGPTFSGAIAGTAAYLSPEAVKGQAPDPSFDLWSIAVVVYEAIAGTNPVLGGSREGTGQRVSFAQIPDIRERVPDCPAPVAEFFRVALHPSPKRRPATGRALAGQLRSLLEKWTPTAVG